MNHALTVETSVSDEWSTKGDHSFKAIATAENNVNNGYFYTTVSTEAGVSYKLTCDVNNHGETGRVKFFARHGTDTSTQQQLGYVSCPPGEITPVMITGTVPEGCDTLLLMFPCVNGISYVDNICLQEIEASEVS